MKLYLLAFFLCVLAIQSFAQRNLIDSLQNKLKKEKTDTGRAHILYQISAAYEIVKPDSALLLAHESYVFSKKIKYLQGESFSLNIIAGAFDKMGNYIQALAYYLQQLKIEEQKNDPYTLAYVHMSIASLYGNQNDIDKAIYYALIADSIINKDTFLIKDLSIYSKLNIGDMLEKNNKIQTALSYTLQSYNEALKVKNMLVAATALNNLGNIYTKTGDTEKALISYKKAIPILDSLEDNSNLTECSLGLSKIFYTKGLIDSAVYYAKYAYKVSIENKILDHAADASSFLAELYKKKNNIDSAFAFQQIMINLNDSTRSSDKIRLLQSMTIEEQLRQKELAELLEQEKIDRTQKLQLLAIGILIPIFFLSSLYISRKKVHKKIIEFSGILSILLLFEYITLLIHPYVAEKTNHSPILEIIIFVAIAALITPSHHRIQTWVISKLSQIQEKHRQATPIQLDHDPDEQMRPV